MALLVPVLKVACLIKLLDFRCLISNELAYVSDQYSVDDSYRHFILVSPLFLPPPPLFPLKCVRAEIKSKCCCDIHKRTQLQAKEVSVCLCERARGVDKLMLTGRNLGWDFNSRRARACLCRAITVVTKTAYLKVENSAQTTFRFSPVSFCASRGRGGGVRYGSQMNNSQFTHSLPPLSLFSSSPLSVPSSIRVL
jgi:hypothetical protein